MKSRRRTAVRFGILALALGGLWSLYMHVGLLPGRFLNEALLEMGRHSGKKIVCKRILYLPFRGLTFDDLRIFRQDGTPLFSAKRFSAHVRLIPFFREKKIIIDDLFMDEPFFELSLASEKKKALPPTKTVISGQIDVPVVEGATSAPDLKDLAGGPDVLLPENVWLEQVNIRNGRVHLRESKGAPVFEELNSIDLRMGFQKPPLVKFEGRIRVGKDGYASAQVRGHWDLKTDRYDLLLSAVSQKVPDWLKRWQQKRLLIFEHGQFALKAHLLSGDGDDVLFDANAHLKDAELRVSSSRYQGYMHVKAQGSFDSVLKKFKRYKAALELTRVNALDLSPKIKELRELTGMVEIQPNLLTVRTLKGNYKDVAFDASGTVESFTERRVSGKIVSDLTAQQLIGLLPKEESAKLKDIDIQGRCQAVTSLSGSLKTGSKVETKHHLAISGATVKSEKRKLDLSEFNAELGMDKSGLRVQSASFKAGTQPYQVKAFVPYIPGADGWLELRSRELEIRANYVFEKDEALISSATASMPGMKAKFSGRMHQWDDSKLSVRGDAEMRLEDISHYFPANGALKSLSGTLNGPFILNGSVARPMESEFKMDAKGPRVTFGKIHLEDFEIQVRLKNRIMNLPYIHAKFYGGTAGSRMTFNLKGPATSFDSRTYMNSVDLSKLGPDWTPPKAKLAGTLTAQVALKGISQKQESWTGKGAVSVSNGYLWETTQFKAMGELPLVRVEGLDVVTFRGMNALFDIKEKTLHTEDLALSSDTVDLALRGDMAFDGALNMRMAIQYSDDIYRGADDTGGLAPLIVSKAGGSIPDYQVLGTLKEPRYEKMR